MSDPDEKFAAVTAAHRGDIEDLGRLGVTLVGAFPEGGELLDKALSGLNAAALDGVGVKLLERALSAGVLKGFAAPVVVDVSAAARAYRSLGEPKEAEGIEAALMRGRLRLQGTDGVRGLVSLEEDGNPVLHFGRTGRITPAFIELLCAAFGRLCRRNGLVRKAGEVVVAEDGRDAATGGRLAAAMKAGFTAAGLTVVDMGVAPTPAVPFAQARRGIRMGASLTASHNPAGQNGIKFFIDGFKLLPEGPVGDYCLSAVTYKLAERGDLKHEEGKIVADDGLTNEFADFIVSNLPAGAADVLAGIEIVFDPANGSMTRIGERVFSRLGLDVHTVNDDPRGDNINQGGGVAEIEGVRRISAQAAAGSPQLASVAAMIARADETGRDVYGIVMDGDGDRGFVIVAGSGAGEALVVDGDAEAFVLARRLRESDAIPESQAPDWEFVGTVESDLELFRNVETRLGLTTRIACVGDKWLVTGYREGRRLAIGQEVSGHILWPEQTQGPDGEPKEVTSGNGLLTALSAVAAARMLGLSPIELAEPFGPGTFVTRYTYNVDKALFFCGSKAWEASVKAVAKALDAVRGEGFESWRFVERPEEPDMLYIALEDGAGRMAGAVFVRNSGTENKIGVYARGRRSLEPLLESVCLTVAKLHRWICKDRESPAYEMELAVLEALEDGPLEAGRLSEAVNSMLGAGADEEELDSVLFGMRKEGLVEFCDGRIARLE